MERVSASAVAGLFENYPGPPRKKTKPGDYLLNVVFPRGHVREHIALHYLHRCQGIASVHGQNGYARAYEYLEKDLLSTYDKCEWLSGQRELFVTYFMQYLESKVLNAPAAQIAIEETSMLMLNEEQVGRQCLAEIRTLLATAAFTCKAEFETTVVKPVCLVAKRHFFADVLPGHTGYLVSGLPYTLPRYRAKYGSVEVVCQPDGMCTTGDQRAVIEIKSPMYGFYTSHARPALAGVAGRSVAQTACDRRKLWVKYLVQCAIELDVTGADKVLFICWFGGAARYIELSRDMLSTLVDQVQELVRQLGLVDKADGEWLSIQDAYKRLCGVSASMSLPDLRQALEAKGYTDFTFGTGRQQRRKQFFVDKLMELDGGIVHDMNGELARILRTLTKNDQADAWTPLESVYAPHGLDMLADAVDATPEPPTKKTRRA